jgi:hypothetical protein
MGKGEVLFNTYLALCGHFVNRRSLVLRGGVKGKGASVIQYLESNGYIVTTEENEWNLYAKPTGHNHSGGIHYFCSRKQQHQKSAAE